MFNSLIGAEGGSSSWIMIVVVVALMGVMMLVSIIPQRKRRKQAQEMMSKMAKGDTIKTIGGFIGEIIAMEETSFVLDIGVEGTPVYVNIDKAAVYTVIKSLNQPEPQVVETAEGEKVEVKENIKSLDDAEEDAIREAKAKEKASKKANKNKADNAGNAVANSQDNAVEAEVVEVEAEQIKKD